METHGHERPERIRAEAAMATAGAALLAATPAGVGR
jgi:hypothetical protein